MKCTYVSQDGDSFYDQAGGLLFTSSVIVKDGDLAAARLARSQFLNWAHANRSQFTSSCCPHFGQPQPV